MSNNIDESKSNDVQPLATSDRPPWLAHVEDRIAEGNEQFDSGAMYFEIIRDLLLAPDSDDTAIPKAMKRFHEHYVAGFAGKDFGRRQPPEYAAGDVLNEISIAVFETVGKISFTDIRHDRLANFLIGIKRDAADEFSKEAAVAEDWNSSHAQGVTRDNEFRTASQTSHSWVNKSALLAKLFSAGLLDADGTRWISGDFESAFETRTSGELATNIGRKAQVVAQANYILIAGDAYIKEVKQPSKKYRVEVTPARWNLWASKLQEVADTASIDAEWDLKSRAQKAYEKMVELYPEAFKTEETQVDKV
ncbi:hypothetical protein NW754_013216 [Fusarium falciforme]|uniref:Uncharacterized protein n=1 Tax=Fusarium falciforme TaxID=195108 RepID=A0A9W8QXV0_9HYPO|nr:hypothetical protein NW754_013216 [Fusarium falciforme]KAJ4179535.1 hypothetical protein NW755_012444 [Fusarium falciforme]